MSWVTYDARIVVRETESAIYSERSGWSDEVPVTEEEPAPDTLPYGTDEPEPANTRTVTLPAIEPVQMTAQEVREQWPAHFTESDQMFYDLVFIELLRAGKTYEATSIANEATRARRKFFSGR